MFSQLFFLYSALLPTSVLSSPLRCCNCASVGPSQRVLSTQVRFSSTHSIAFVEVTQTTSQAGFDWCLQCASLYIVCPKSQVSRPTVGTWYSYQVILFEHSNAGLVSQVLFIGGFLIAGQRTAL